jgi:PTH1 family peptidyl-tRNA hydrolase
VEPQKPLQSRSNQRVILEHSLPRKIQLIVGLGNPGLSYEATRHNVGAWFVEAVAREQGLPLKTESKLMGRAAKVRLDNEEYWLFVPNTFMNHSGLAVKTICHFYKIPPEEVLVVHDELDFPAGTARLKYNGGHGGHNGIRNIIEQLHQRDFSRLRIGIGHPGHRDLVTDYVLHKPSKKEYELIMSAIHSATIILPSLLNGDFDQAVENLHRD